MNELQTMGIVIDHKSRSSVGFDSYSRLLFPVVRFETQDGKTVEFESGLGTNIPPRVGEAENVIRWVCASERFDTRQRPRPRPRGVGTLLQGVFRDGGD